MKGFVSGNDVRIVPKEDLMMVRELALRIFPVTYRHIVEAAHIDYMMDLMYSEKALTDQWEAGQVFLIIYAEGHASGYAAYSRLDNKGIFKLNKIYVDTSLQGKGLGRTLLTEIISRVKTAGATSLRLNVHRHNKAQGFYEAMGFSILEEELLDIGNGYFMDDYVMELPLK